MSTDASKYAVGATLEQDGHPVALLSHRLSDVKVNWDTSDQELPAFMIALREGSTYLRGRTFALLTDHKPIRYLQTKPKLSSRQFRSLDVLQEHNDDVEHVPGSQHSVPDALSRRPDHIPAIALKGLSLRDPAFPHRIRAGYVDDPWATKLLMCLRDGEETEDRKVSVQRPNYTYDDGFLYWVGSNDQIVYVPQGSDFRLDFLKHYHETDLLGIDKVFNSCTLHVFWPKMYEDVRACVGGFQECLENKKANTRLAGELFPLAILEKCWDVVTTDLLTELPTSNTGHDAVLVIVDKLSK